MNKKFYTFELDKLINNFRFVGRYLTAGVLEHFRFFI